MDDRQFKTLLHALGYSFEGYRRVRKGVKNLIWPEFVITIPQFDRQMKPPTRTV